MKKFLIGVAAAATVAGPMLVLPTYSEAGNRHHRRHAVSERSYEARCHRSRRIHARRGTVIGAILGGVAGNAIGRGGGRTGATVVGAGVGAVAGHQIGRNNARC